jgi:S1-C subfamily serine protease
MGAVTIAGLDFNLLDLILVVALLYALLRGWMQGAVSQVAAFGGAAAGLFVGAWAAPLVARLLVDEPGPTLALLTLGLLLVLVLLGQGLGLGLGLRLRHAAHRAGIGVVDRVAGVGVGVLGLLVVVWLLSSVLAQGPFPAVAEQVRQSEVVDALDDRLPPPPDVFGRVASYLDEQGFPQVFAGPGRAVTAPPVGPTSDAAVRAAADAGQASTVQVRATGCGAQVSLGSGFVTQPGFVVTNAHVIAGTDRIQVRDLSGEYDAVPVHFDPDLDLAVLSSPGLQAPALAWTGAAAERGVEGATLGFPGGQPEMVVKPATVRSRSEALGRDIYGRGAVLRQILDLSSDVRRGDSGGPFVTRDGQVAGVVFAANAAQRGNGYALTAERVRDDVDGAVARAERVGTGQCRF